MAGTANAPNRAAAATFLSVQCVFIKSLSPLIHMRGVVEMRIGLGLVGRRPKVKLFPNWFYCADKYSTPISAVATGDCVAPTISARDRGAVTSKGFPTGPEN
jgi:hypothetical protein